MRRLKWTVGASALSVVFASGSAMLAGAQQVPDRWLRPPAEEVDHARSAAPAEVSEEATVWVLGAGGFRIDQRGTNRFHCMVRRLRHPGDVIPECFNPAAVERVMPLWQDVVLAVARGTPFREAWSTITDHLESGAIALPEAGRAVAYLMIPTGRPGRGIPADLPGESPTSPPDTVLVTPDPESVDASRIEPYEVVWVQYFETEGARTLRRTIVDRVERESPDDADRLVRTQTFLGLDGEPTSERVNRVDGVTLAPLRERWSFRERVTHVDYEGAHVSGAMIRDSGRGPATLFDEELQRPGFDLNVLPLLLSAVELEAGVALRIPQVRISPPAFSVPETVWAVIDVEGREEVDAGPLGRVAAWKAVDRAHDMVFWVINEAPYLVRVQFPVDDATLSVMELGAVRSP